MRKKKERWIPQPGSMAAYVGQAKGVVMYGRRVLVVAEACGKRMVVEAINPQGNSIRFTIAAHNLARPQPDLFD